MFPIPEVQGSSPSQVWHLYTLPIPIHPVQAKSLSYRMAVKPILPLRVVESKILSKIFRSAGQPACKILSGKTYLYKIKYLKKNF